MNHISLINVNGCIGRGAYEKPDFKDVSALLSHMDYLGIDRSLAWHVSARDLNPYWGNKQLLQCIEEAEAEERIIPAFVITPACFYEYGTLDFLRENLASEKVKALRITPEKSRFQIRHIERLLLELEKYEPLVLWDCPAFTEEQNFLDLEHLARKMPQINFAITQKMWLGFGSILDLMWRCPNVFVDISWLHMRDAIELLVENFGAERVLFGIGYKVHYGAAIAALVHARVTPAQRKLIAHGNIERLLGLQTMPRNLINSPAILEQKPLWQKFSKGQPVENVTIVDAHTHTSPFTRGWFMRENNLEKNSLELISQMDALGIDKSIICPETALFGPSLEGNLMVQAVMKKHPERFAGYLAFNPFYAEEMIPEFDNFFKKGFFIGFKLVASYLKIPLTDKVFTPVWEYADKHHMPILLHTWNDKYDSPGMLADIVVKYPNVRFIIGHSGGGENGRKEAEELALATPNVFLEFCGSFTTRIPFDESASKVGWKRVIFGTDTGPHNAAWELGRFLSMPVADKILTPALGENFLKLI